MEPRHPREGGFTLTSGLDACRALIVAVALFLCAPAAASSLDVDHYVLSLSWSPTFCAVTGDQRQAPECSSGKSHAFVVHGLWPQFEEGSIDNCDTRERWVPEALIARLRPIMPSKSLVIHEWRKHGTCSGLSMRSYFELTETLYRKVKIPARYLSPTSPIVTDVDEIEDDFVTTNAGLGADMLSLECARDGGRIRLSDVRICFALDGRFTSCRSEGRRSCGSARLVIPPLKRTGSRITAPPGEAWEDE